MDCIYQSVLVTVTRCNITNYTNQTISIEIFYGINKVLIDGTRENMEFMIQKYNYGDISKTDTKQWDIIFQVSFK